MDERTAHRMRSLLAAEAGNPPIWWWLSFADDDGFRGACLVKAGGMLSAVAESHRLRINPGGQVLAVAVPSGVDIPSAFVNRLLDKAEAESDDLRSILTPVDA